MTVLRAYRLPYPWSIRVPSIGNSVNTKICAFTKSTLAYAGAQRSVKHLAVSISLLSNFMATLMDNKAVLIYFLIFFTIGMPSHR